ncbi:hypothetical protein CBER1_07981 [Cercospora berteroae]|uniref:Uncharacterized protein n=1 Tax=Cercospora berteroae TaxID=357750 RepID=A0A2S6BVM2_9PEZI|nr:hypothetical protein CBER1_07981 [Cercospora berteroae]
MTGARWRCMLPKKNVVVRQAFSELSFSADGQVEGEKRFERSCRRPERTRAEGDELERISTVVASVGEGRPVLAKASVCVKLPGEHPLLSPLFHPTPRTRAGATRTRPVQIIAEEMEIYDEEWLEDEPPVTPTYSGYFARAAEHLREKKYARAGYRAKLNLMDLWLPRFWQIKNCIIIICSEDDWDEAQAYIDIAEEVWEAARAEVADETATWPPSLRSDFERLKEDQEKQRERWHPPPQLEQQQHEVQEGDEHDLWPYDDSLWPYDDEDYVEGMEDDQYDAAYDEWDSEDERRDRSKEPDGLMAIRMTLMKPEAVVDDIVANGQHQLQQRVNFEVREEEEEEPQQELLDSPERQKMQNSELEAPRTWVARLSMAIQSVRYMYLRASALILPGNSHMPSFSHLRTATQLYGDEKPYF